MTYEKYSVKENRSGNLETGRDGKPVLGEKINEVRLDEQTVSLLNRNWENFKEYFVLVGEKKIEVKPVVTETVIATVILPEPFNPVQFSKTATAEMYADLSDAEIDSALEQLSKKQVMTLFGIEIDEKFFGKTPKTDIVISAKAKINELKSK